MATRRIPFVPIGTSAGIGWADWLVCVGILSDDEYHVRAHSARPLRIGGCARMALAWRASEYVHGGVVRAQPGVTTIALAEEVGSEPARRRVGLPVMVETRATCPIAAELLVQVRRGLKT